MAHLVIDLGLPPLFRLSLLIQVLAAGLRLRLPPLLLRLIGGNLRPSLGGANITDNVVGTINYISITTSLVTGNIVSNVGGITSSGTNTNTTAIHNLVNTTFA